MCGKKYEVYECDASPDSMVPAYYSKDNLVCRIATDHTIEHPYNKQHVIPDTLKSGKMQ